MRMLSYARRRRIKRTEAEGSFCFKLCFEEKQRNKPLLARSISKTNFFMLLFFPFFLFFSPSVDNTSNTTSMSLQRLQHRVSPLLRVSAKSSHFSSGSSSSGKDG